MLILAAPYVLATALASKLRSCGRYDVVVPDLRAAHLPLSGPWDAIVTAGDGPTGRSAIVIQLPISFQNPVRVTVDGRRREVLVSDRHPIDDVLALLDDHLAEHT